MKTPLAFFAYNRPQHTRRALSALAKCRRLSECEVHLFSDGPKTDAARPDVEATRAVLHEWAAANGAQLIAQPTNLGLAKSIATGVTDLCARYGRAIVVEDDLIVSPGFLHFMLESLEHYESDERVMQVGGFTLSPPGTLLTDAFLLPVTTTWGWGTWQRAWQAFSWMPEDLQASSLDDEWRRLFNLNGAGSFSSMLEDRLAGKNDSWGILWWYAVSRRRGLVVYPAQSLVWNGGFDGSGVHCGSGDFLEQGDAASYSHERLCTALTFPERTQFENRHLSQLENFFLSKQAPATVAGPHSGLKDRVISLARSLKETLKNAIS